MFATWSQRLHQIAQKGLTHTPDVFSRERYQQILAIAATMSETTDLQPPSLSSSLFQHHIPPITPKTGVRGAIIKDDKILLVREQGVWALPGGFCDVGDSPSQAIIREIWEESGYEVRIIKLYGMYDRTIQNHPIHPEALSFHMFYFLCEIIGGSAATTGIETDAVGFFAENALPPLALLKTVPQQIARAFVHHRQPDLATDFD